MQEILSHHITTNFSPISLSEYEERKKRKWQQEYESEIRQKKADQVKKAMEYSGLDMLIRDKTFDKYDAVEDWQKIAKASCMKYASNPDKWLLVSGPTGSGKTHLCTAVVGSMINKGIPVWYMLYREEIDKLKLMEGVDPEEREKKMRLYKTAQVLYIDDLFKGGASKADVKAIFELIDYRRRTNKITIISTEMTPQQIAEIDEAVAGRIVENTKKVLIKYEKDRNYRMKGSVEK